MHSRGDVVAAWFGWSESTRGRTTRFTGWDASTALVVGYVHLVTFGTLVVTGITDPRAYAVTLLLFPVTVVTARFTLEVGPGGLRLGVGVFGGRRWRTFPLSAPIRAAGQGSWGLTGPPGFTYLLEVQPRPHDVVDTYAFGAAHHVATLAAAIDAARARAVACQTPHTTRDT